MFGQIIAGIWKKTIKMFGQTEDWKNSLDEI